MNCKTFTGACLAARLAWGILTATLAGHAQSAPPQLAYGVPQVLQLAKSRVSDPTIIAYIKNSGIHYDLNGDQVIYLRDQGISQAVIAAMLNADKPGARPAPAAPGLNPGFTPPPGVNRAANATAVEIRQGAVFIQGNLFTRDSKLSEYEAVLGNPDRSSHKINTIYTYDDLGLCLYQRPGEETILEISLYLKKKTNEFAPHTVFPGVFKIDGRVLNSDFPQSALRDLGALHIVTRNETASRPVTKAAYENVILFFDYLASRAQLERIAIEWAKEPANQNPSVAIEDRQPSAADRRAAVGVSNQGVAKGGRVSEVDRREAARFNEQGVAKGDRGDPDGEIADCTKAIELNPFEAVYYFNRGFAKGNKDDVDGEIADCTKAIELNPGNALAYNNRGFAKGKKEDFDGEIADCTSAIELAPGYAVAYNNRGYAKCGRRDFSGAIADYDRAIALDAQPEAFYKSRGYAKAQIQDFAGAIADYDRAIALAPQDTAAFKNRGSAKFARQDYAEAIADYDRAISLNPKDAALFANRGRAKAARQDLPGAMADFTEAIALNPRDSDSFARRAGAELTGRDFAGAVADYDRVIALDAQDAAAFAGRGRAKFGGQDFTGAIADLTKAVELNPKDASSFANLANAKIARQDFAGAVADYDRVIVLGSQDATAFAGRGRAKFGGRDFTGAIADLTKAVELNPKDANSFANRAQAKVARQDFVEAIADYEKAITLDPAYVPTAVEALGKLQDAHAAAAMIGMLADGREVIRRTGREALVRLGPLAVDPLLEAAVVPGSGGRTNVIGVLGKLGDRRAVNPLIEILPESEVRESAAGALEALGEPLGKVFVQTLQGDRAASARLIASKDSRFVAQLARALTDPKLRVRQNAALALSELGDERAVEPLIKVLVADRKVELAEALALKHGGASPAFINALVHEKASRVEAAVALGRIGDARAVSALIQSLGDPDESVRQSAAQALWLRARPVGATQWAAPMAGGRSWSPRLLAGTYLTGEPRAGTAGFVRACALTVFSPASLAYSAGLAVVFGLLGGWWARLRQQTLPGIGGWAALGWGFVVVALYGGILRWTWGTGVFLAVALTPVWLSLLVGVGCGLFRWPAARKQMAGLVCRDDFHRFVPGPNLGWLVRWSGRWLWREKDGPGNLADSCVCRVCGHTRRYEGIREVIAVLDHAQKFYRQQQGMALRVNWLDQKQPFDFDRVEVVAATDTEVEEFIRQMRYQSDQRVQKRLRKTACVVNAQCRFERENTLTLLRQTFGDVTKD